MSKKTWVIIFAVAIGAYLFGLTQNSSFNKASVLSKYQGKTAQEWASKANKNQQQVDFLQRSISKLDPNSLMDSPTPLPANPHAGMKEIKGMDCQPSGNNGGMNCTNYDTWYDPNAAPQDWSDIKQ